MDRKTKRIVALVTVIVLVIFSLLINGRQTEETSKNGLMDYINSYTQDTTVKYTLVAGNSSEVIRKISVDGEIGSEMINTYSSTSVLSQIKDAAKDTNVKAILLSVNSPGGGVYETAELYKELKKSGKDVYVSMKNYAASGGYYISMAAKKIYAHEETTTGSIGVIRSHLTLQKFLNDKGIKSEVVRSGEQKAVGGLTEDWNEGTRKIYEEQNKESFDRFVKVIAEGRNMSEEDVRKLADGRTYSGTQAVNNKLIDKIGSEEDLINFIKEDKKLSNPQVEEVRESKAATSLFGRLIKATTESVVSELKSELSSSQVEKSYIAQ